MSMMSVFLGRKSSVPDTSLVVRGPLGHGTDCANTLAAITGGMASGSYRNLPKCERCGSQVPSGRLNTPHYVSENSK